MKRFAAAIIAALMLAAPPALAEAVLRPNVIVDGDVIKIGDLFDNAGDKADIAVARAPAPGKRVTVDAQWLRRVAATNKLDWKPQSNFDQAVIERSGQVVTHDQIEAAIATALGGENLPPDSVVELANPSTQMTVPVGILPEIGVRDLAYDNRYKRFTATIEVPAGSPSAARTRVAGRVTRSIEIPVLAHAVSRGDVITARDLTMTKLSEDRVRGDFVTDPSQLIGLEARQSLRSGQPLSASDVQKQIAVARGALVTLVLKYGSMTLTAQGRALEQGSIGDTIRVTNTHSNQTVEGKIEGPNVVSVSPNGSGALAN